MRKSSVDFAQEARAIVREAEDSGRDLTSSEKGEVEALLDLAAERKSSEDKRAQVENLSRDLAGGVNTPTSGEFGGGAPGDIFVKSAGYKSIRDPGSRGQTFSTGPVEVELQTKGTLVSTPGTALTPAEYQPGVVQTLFQPLYVADLLGSGTTNASQIRYVTESTATNAAEAVSEGSAKPESTLAFSEVTEPVRKIATFLPTSDEMLEDAPSIQAYLNSRLELFVRIKEEQQLLYGTGTAPQLKGIFNRSNIQNHNRGTFTPLDAIRQMITKSRTSFLEPDGVVVHPDQWEAIEVYKTTTGEYLGDPFRGGPRTLWNLPVVVSTVVGSGTVLVGAFKQAAKRVTRGGLTVEASNSHQDFFQKNLTAIRAEIREALCVYRESSFVRGTAF